MEDAQRREIALFRYALVRQCADPDLTSRQRGRLVRDLTARDHVGPDGQRRRLRGSWPSSPRSRRSDRLR